MKSLGALTITCVLAAGCGTTSPIAPYPAAESPTATARSSDIVHIPLFVENANRQPAAGGGTPVFETRRHNPVIARDGRQITLAEFTSVEGNVSVQCGRAGTSVTIQLRHLIPNGVYTIWNVVFKAPGFDPTFANLIGLGALGSPIGTQNVFRASASGEGSISATTGAGPLSTSGSIGACAPSDEFEWHVVGAYHLDGESHGPSLGPEG